MPLLSSQMCIHHANLSSFCLQHHSIQISHWHKIFHVFTAVKPFRISSSKMCTTFASTINYKIKMIHRSLSARANNKWNSISWENSFCRSTSETGWNDENLVNNNKNMTNSNGYNQIIRLRHNSRYNVVQTTWWASFGLGFEPKPRWSSHISIHVFVCSSP